MHQSDRVIKPIIGNKSIEDTGLVSYYKSKLPFTPWKKDVLKEMINSEKDLKNVEKYLYEIYTVLEQYANKNDYDNLINLLKGLTSDKRNKVFIVAGKGPKELKEWFGSVRGLGLAAEHGFKYWVNKSGNELLEQGITT